MIEKGPFFIGGTPKRFIWAEAENIPEQLGPMILAPPCSAMRNISTSIFFPFSPVSPNPAVIITIPFASIFTLSATTWGINFAGIIIITRST